VAPERDAVEKISGELNHLLGRANDFTIDVYRWETDSGPGFHAEGPQGKIDHDLGIADCDIMVAIFWTKFGSPILKKSETGTEHEINRAFERWRKTNKKPQILVYFKTAAMEWDLIDGTQIDRVKKFKSEFQPGGRYQEGKYSTFGNIEEFKDKLQQHLPEHLPKGLQLPPPLPGGFDIEGYRTSFGYEPKWDLANIGAAQAPGDAPVSLALEDIYQELRIADKLDPKELSLGVGWSPGLRQTVKTLLTVRCKFIADSLDQDGKNAKLRHC